MSCFLAWCCVVLCCAVLGCVELCCVGLGWVGLCCAVLLWISFLLQEVNHLLHHLLLKPFGLAGGAHSGLAASQHPFLSLKLSDSPSPQVSHSGPSCPPPPPQYRVASLLSLWCRHRNSHAELPTQKRMCHDTKKACESGCLTCTSPFQGPEPHVS